MTLNTIPQPTTPPSCALLEERLHWRILVSCAGNEPVLRWKRTRMTQIKRIFTDFPIRANPCHPRNPCSTVASLFVDAPYSKDSDRINRMDRINPLTNPVNPVHPVDSISSFSAAPDINFSEFIKIWISQNSSPQSHHIPPTSSSKPGTLLSERRLNTARKTKYAFLQLFNSKIDKTGDNENI